LSIGANAFDDCTAVDIEQLDGYVFLGWTNAVGKIVDDPFHSDEAVVVSPWMERAVDVIFDANGGIVSDYVVKFTVNSAIGRLPTPTYGDSVFLGWFTARDGGDRVDESFIVRENTSLYAHWLTEVATPVIVANKGDGFRYNPCVVEILCATEDAIIYYSDDGTTPKKNESYRYKGPFTIRDTSTIKAVAVFAGLASEYVTVTIEKKLLTVSESLDVDENVVIETSNTVPWMPIFDSEAKIGDAMAQSGTIGDRTSTWLSATVTGAGTMSFWCKVSCEHDEDNTFTWDRLMVYTNGVEITEWRMDGETDWVQRTLSFAEGENTVKWVYYKDKSDSEGADCAWVDGVAWIPESNDVTVEVGGGKCVVVPVEWIDSHADIVAAAGGDKAAALQRTAANGRKVWECFMLGVDPAKADDDFKITRFWMEDGVPKFEFSHSADGAGNSFVPRIKTLGKEKLTDSWQDVPSGGNPSFRFFTVDVELP
jgi:hypothetical protein